MSKATKMIESKATKIIVTGNHEDLDAGSLTSRKRSFRTGSFKRNSPWN